MENPNSKQDEEYEVLYDEKGLAYLKVKRVEEPKVEIKNFENLETRLGTKFMIVLFDVGVTPVAVIGINSRNKASAALAERPASPKGDWREKVC